MHNVFPSCLYISLLIYLLPATLSLNQMLKSKNFSVISFLFNKTNELLSTFLPNLEVSWSFKGGYHVSVSTSFLMEEWEIQFDKDWVTVIHFETETENRKLNTAILFRFIAFLLLFLSLVGRKSQWQKWKKVNYSFPGKNQESGMFER